MKRRNKILLAIGLLAVIFIVFQFPFAKLAGPRQHVSDDTTRITEPVREDGAVDYLRALNDRLSQGVTADNNALVALSPWLAMEPLEGEAYQRFLSQLGVEELPESQHLTGALAYLNEHHPLDDVSPRIDEQSLLMSRPWTAEEYPLWAEALAHDQLSLDKIVEHSQHSRYYHPLVCQAEYPDDSLVFCLLSFSQQLRHAGRELALRAMFSLGTGETNAAIADIKTIRRLASLNRQSLTLVEQLISNALDGMAHLCEMQLLSHGGMTAEQLADYRDFLLALEQHYTTANRLDIGERFMMLDMMQKANLHGRFIGDPLGPNETMEWASWFFFFIDWNESMRVANATYDTIVTAASIPDPTLRLKMLDQFNVELEQEEQLLYGLPMATSMIAGPGSRGRHFGKMFTHYLLPATSQVAVSDVRTALQKEMTLVGIRLEEFYVRHQHYPDRLEQLVPDYLPQLPIDPFNGEDLKYTLKDRGYVLWSVGTDLVDDGGLDYEDRKSRRDTYDLPHKVNKPAEF